MFNFFKKCCGTALAVFALYFAMGTASAQCATEAYTVNVTPGLYASEVSWQIYDGNNLVAGGVPGTSTVQLAPGQLTFLGVDAWGDGWNGAQATVTRVSNGEVILSNWTFTSGTEATATLNTGNVATLTVTAGSWAAEVSWSITDAAGTTWTGNAPTTITLCNFASGAFTFNGVDSYCDGWNGATATLVWNGNTVMNAFTFNSGCNSSFTGSASFAVPGCTDPNALNYNPAATEDNGSCLYPTCASSGTYCYPNGIPAASPTVFIDHTSIAGNTAVLSFTQGNVETGWDRLQIYQDLPLTAANRIYDSGTAFNGNLNITGLNLISTTGRFIATISSDGSVACESFGYLPFVWEVSCEVLGCNDPLACNLNPNATYNDGTCDYSCVGCMDPQAANYNPNATQQNPGSCVYCAAGTYVAAVTMTDSGNDGWEGAQYFISNLSTGTVTSGGFDNADVNVGGVATDYNCLPLGCYTFTVAGGTGIGEVGYTLTDQFGTTYLTGTGAITQYNVDFGLQGTCGFAGCTDPYCFNYNISATVDNGSCICPPPNNALELAEAVFCGATVNGTLANATDEDNVTGFPGFLSAITTPGVWYEFNATTTQQVIVDLCGTQFAGFASPVSNTKLHVFRQLADGTLQPIVSNDNTCNLHASAAFLAETGGNYFIYVSKSSTFNTGTSFLLSVNCESCAGEVPFNDVCEDAFPQFSGVTFTGSVCCASSPSIPSFNGNATTTNYGVWFTFNSSDYDTFYFNLTNVDAAQLTLTIYTIGGDCSTVTGAAGTVVGCAFTGQCAGSIESFIDLVPDTDYYFLVGTTNPAGCGDFEFTTTGIYLGCTDPLASNYDQQATQDDGTCTYNQAPPNDLCANAITLPCNQGFIPGSLGGATPDLQSSLCVPGAPQITPCVTAVNGAYPSGTFTPTCTGATQNITTCGYGSEYSRVNVVAGTTYVFSSSITTDICTIANNIAPISAFTAGIGTVTWTATFTGVVRFYTHIANCGAQSVCRTKRVSCGGPAPSIPGGIWYKFVGAGDLTQVYTCGSNLNTKMHIYKSTATNGSCSSLGCVNQLDGTVAINAESFAGCGFFDQNDAYIEFVTEVGTTYYVYVEAEGPQNGSIQIAMDCEPAVFGCQVSAACNYNPNANIDDGSCEYTSCACVNNPGGTAVVIEMSDSFGDGWVGGNAGSPGGYEILTPTGTVVTSGSIDNAEYTVDEDNYDGPEFGLDVTCLSDGCYIFRFTGAFQWSEEQSWALVVDGVEVLTGAPSGDGAVQDYQFTIGDAVCGCTDDGACNYDQAATDDNGTCEYTTCAGCTDPNTCTWEPFATIDDGSCCYDNCITITMNDSFGDGWQGCQIIITDLNGQVIVQTGIPNGGGSSLVQQFCLADGCYTISSTDDTFDGEVSWTVTGIFGGAISGGSNFAQTYISAGGNNCISGCTIACACNYNPAANITNLAACTFDNCSGCTYPDAENYDPNAGTDDGSCTFDLQNPCPADLNQDGSVTTADLLQFLGAFGTVCQ